VGALNSVNATPLLLALLAGRVPPAELTGLLLTREVALAQADSGVGLLHALARLAGPAACAPETRARLLELAAAAVALGASAEAPDEAGCSAALAWLLRGELAARQRFGAAVALSPEALLRAETATEQRGDSYAWRIVSDPLTPDDEKATKKEKAKIVFFFKKKPDACFEKCEC